MVVYKGEGTRIIASDFLMSGPINTGVLFDAIFDRFTDSPLDDILTDLYNTEAPALSTEDDDGGAVYPYGVVKIPSNAPGVGEFGAEWEDLIVLFSMYSDDTTMTVLGNAFDALESLYYHYDLTPETITMERENANIFRKEGIWVYDVTYKLLIEKG